MVRRCVRSINLLNVEALAHWGLLRQNKKRKKLYALIYHNTLPNCCNCSVYFLCCSMYFCVVLCIFMLFSVLFVLFYVFFVLFYVFFVLFYVFFVLFYVFLCCSLYCLCVYMCTGQLPPSGYPISVKHIITKHCCRIQQFLSRILWKCYIKSVKRRHIMGKNL